MRPSVTSPFGAPSWPRAGCQESTGNHGEAHVAVPGPCHTKPVQLAESVRTWIGQAVHPHRDLRPRRRANVSIDGDGQIDLTVLQGSIEKIRHPLVELSH